MRGLEGSATEARLPRSFCAEANADLESERPVEPERSWFSKPGWPKEPSFLVSTLSALALTTDWFCSSAILSFLVSCGLAGSGGCAGAKSRDAPSGTLTPRWLGGRFFSSSISFSAGWEAPVVAWDSAVLSLLLRLLKGLADLSQLLPFFEESLDASVSLLSSTLLPSVVSVVLSCSVVKRQYHTAFFTTRNIVLLSAVFSVLSEASVQSINVCSVSRAV